MTFYEWSIPGTELFTETRDRSAEFEGLLEKFFCGVANYESSDSMRAAASGQIQGEYLDTLGLRAYAR